MKVHEISIMMCICEWSLLAFIDTNPSISINMTSIGMEADCCSTTEMIIRPLLTFPAHVLTLFMCQTEGSGAKSGPPVQSMQPAGCV